MRPILAQPASVGYDPERAMNTLTASAILDLAGSHFAAGRRAGTGGEKGLAPPARIRPHDHADDALSVPAILRPGPDAEA
jgi:hypothetical protein